MIALLLLLIAQADALPTDASPLPGSSSAPQRICHRAPGSEMVTCARRKPQQPYRLMNVAPRVYGPAQTNAQAGTSHDVKLRGQVTNSAGKRKRSMATLAVPF